MTFSASILFLVILGMTIHALVGRSMNMQGAALPTNKKDKALRIKGIFDRAKERIARLQQDRRAIIAEVIARADAARLAAAKKKLDNV